MKTVFHCDNENDKLEINTILKAGDICIAICDFREYLRQIIKYADEGVSDEILKERELIREKFHECFDEVISIYQD